MTLLTNNSSVKVILVPKKASEIEKTLLSKKKVTKSALKKNSLTSFWSDITNSREKRY